MLKKLQQAQAGEAFDKMYVDGQLQGHEELLQIQETVPEEQQPQPRARQRRQTRPRPHQGHVQVLKDLKEAL
jgi:putative membrane protein